MGPAKKRILLACRPGVVFIHGPLQPGRIQADLAGQGFKRVGADDPSGFQILAEIHRRDARALSLEHRLVVDLERTRFGLLQAGIANQLVGFGFVGEALRIQVDSDAAGVHPETQEMVARPGADMAAERALDIPHVTKRGPKLPGHDQPVTQVAVATHALGAGLRRRK